MQRSQFDNGSRTSQSGSETHSITRVILLACLLCVICVPVARAQTPRPSPKEPARIQPADIEAAPTEMPPRPDPSEGPNSLQVYTLVVEAGCQLEPLLQRLKSMRAAGDLLVDPIRMGERFRLVAAGGQLQSLRGAVCVEDLFPGWKEMEPEPVAGPLTGETSEGRHDMAAAVEQPLQTEALGGISGAVIDETSGLPLPDITVEVYDYPAPESGWSLVDSITTDSFGSFFIGNLVSGLYRVGFFDLLSGTYIGEYFDNVYTLGSGTDVPVSDDATTANINAELSEPAQITGEVTAEDGGGDLQGIDVVAYRQYAGGWELVGSDTTASDGTYLLGDLLSGTYRIFFSDYTGQFLSEYYAGAADFQSGDDVSVTSGAAIPGINASLETAGHITGIITAETNGAPLELIAVDAYRFNGSYWDYAGYAYTDENGLYDVGGLSAGTYRLRFSDWNGTYAGEYYDDVLDLDSATDISLVAGGTISGRNAALAMGAHITGTVTDQSGGTPLQSIYVEAYRFNDSFWDYAGYAYTDENGLYDVGGLPAGTYRLGFFDWNGNYVKEYYDDTLYLESASDITVAAGDMIPGKNAALAAVAAINGIVTAEDGGAPLPNIYVEAYRFNGSYWAYVDYVYTDSSGYYEIGELPAGIYRLGYFDWDYGAYISEYFDNAADLDGATDIVVAAGATVAGTNAALATAAHIAGTITAETGGAYLPDIDVTAYAYDGFDWVDVAYGYTDIYGQYDIGGLAADTYRVRFTDYNGAYVQEYYVNAANVYNAADIPVSAGGSAGGIDEALADAGYITGTVTAETGGAPISDIYVCPFFWGDYGWESRYDLCSWSDSGGQFVLDGLAAGQYRVLYWDLSAFYGVEYFSDVLSFNIASDISVTAGATSPGIDATLVEAGQINGTVTAESDGAPVPNIEVCANYSYGGNWERVGFCSYTDEYGDYVIERLPAGAYRVSFTDYNGAYVDEAYDDAPDLDAADDVAVTSGGAVSGVDAALERVPPPVNDDFDAALDASPLPYQDERDTRGATTAIDDPDLPCGPGDQGSGSVWYTITSAQPVQLYADTFGSNYDTVLAVWQGERGSLSALACNDDSGNLQSQVADVPLNAGVTYTLEVAGYDSDLGDLALYVELMPASPFLDCVSNTGSDATVAVPAAVTVLGGVTLQPGDEFALFTPDGAICAGHGIWDGGSLGITAWGDDSQTTARDGFTAGEVMRWALWDSSENVVYDPLQVAYSQGNGIYSDNSMHVVSEIEVNLTVTHEIELSAGWNLISTYVAPDDPTLFTILSALGSDLVLLKNGAGQVYWPAYGIDQLGDWDVLDGYQVYMNNPATLSISGHAVDPAATPINLGAGWNMAAYLRSTAMPIDQAVTSISAELYLAKNGAGQVYWPAFGINNIGSMQPGQGYQLYMNSAGALTYELE